MYKTENRTLRNIYTWAQEEENKPAKTSRGQTEGRAKGSDITKAEEKVSSKNKWISAT